MGRKVRNPIWREANIWEKPEPPRRYSTWATTATWRTSTWGTNNDVESDPDLEAQTQEQEPEEKEEEEDEKKKTKKGSIWRSLACGMKVSIYSISMEHHLETPSTVALAPTAYTIHHDHPALACDMFKARFPLDRPSPLPFPLHFSVSSTTQKRGTGGKGGPSTSPMFRLPSNWTL